MTINTALTDWLLRVTATERPPSTIIAYHIGLFETADGYCAYLIGADRFDADDSDWACNEAYSPAERYQPLPDGQGPHPDWQAVLDAVTAATKAFVATPPGTVTFLASCTALTVGFDDGDVERIR